jgi:multicomponent Na+:H+ antiporter subunit G
VSSLLAVLDVVAMLLVGIGLLFFVGAALGVLRFPDLHTRLHAVAKADTLGLICIALGVSIAAADPGVTVRAALVCVLVLAASATTCTLLARAAREDDADDA